MCYIYKYHFGIRSDEIHIVPTLDRFNNKRGHSLSNFKPCFKRYNSLNLDSDNLEMLKLKVQLNNFDHEYGLPIN
jgi:hypothetical protein